MIRYRTRFDKIEALEIENETAHTVTINRSRVNKRSVWQNWHETFEDAKQFVIEDAQREVDRLRASLEMAESKLENAKGMKAI